VVTDTNYMTATREFLGRAAQRGECMKCGRELGMTYALRLNGKAVTYGRRCAARAMGWATSRVEMAAIQAERADELARRRAVIAAERPDMADVPFHLVATAAAQDCWWGGRGWAAFATWQEYLDEYAPVSA
jgi:hypothetical protein